MRMQSAYAGGNDGCLRVYDLTDGSEVATFAAGHDTVNGCAYHPFLPLLGTASGTTIRRLLVFARVLYTRASRQSADASA
jgi:WD40 repeat protein